MENPYLIALIGLTGAFIGVIGSVITTIIQSKIIDKRERNKLVCNTAIEAHKYIADLVKSGGQKVRIAPLVASIHYYDKVIDLVERKKLDSGKSEKN